MAFLRKAGSLLRKTTGCQINSEIFGTNPSVFKIIRCMSTAKIFVGGLSYNTSDQSLGQAFSKYGEVHEARVIVDRESGNSRGFGFVTFGTPEEASAAIQALDSQELDGRRVRVNFANERRRGGDGGGYSGGGGYGGDNYNQDGGNYNQGGSNYNPSGGNYSQGSNFDNVSGGDFRTGNQGFGAGANSSFGNDFGQNDSNEPGDYANRA